MAAAVDELQAQLLETELAKDKAEEELAATQIEIDKLKEREEEFRKLKLAAQKKVRFAC